MSQVLVVVVGLVGFALIASGLWMIWPPLGVVAVGSALIRAAFVVDSQQVDA